MAASAWVLSDALICWETLGVTGFRAVSRWSMNIHVLLTDETGHLEARAEIRVVRAALRRSALQWTTRRECRRWDLKGSAGLPRRTVDQLNRVII